MLMYSDASEQHIHSTYRYIEQQNVGTKKNEENNENSAKSTNVRKRNCIKRKETKTVDRTNNASLAFPKHFFRSFLIYFWYFQILCMWKWKSVESNLEK